MSLLVAAFFLKVSGAVNRIARDQMSIEVVETHAALPESLHRGSIIVDLGARNI